MAVVAVQIVAVRLPVQDDILNNILISWERPSLMNEDDYFQTVRAVEDSNRYISEKHFQEGELGCED